MPLNRCYSEEMEELALDPSSTQVLTKALWGGWFGHSCARSSSGPRQRYMVVRFEGQRMSLGVGKRNKSNLGASLAWAEP